ncbi:MAG: AAA family ATPase [Cytophagales bacterium]|nr:MAG: AAA family ATPase [Cytophagales bacterium]
MITPEEFPYITSIHVNDCYAYQNFDIPLFDYKPEKPFSHLILTGKNGSGKSTILRGLDNYFGGWRSDSLPMTGQSNVAQHLAQLDKIIKTRTTTHGPQEKEVLNFKRELERFERVIPNTLIESIPFWRRNKDSSVYAYFPIRRESKVDDVEVPTPETDFTKKLNSPDSTSFFTRKFVQYLVNQKVEQAFSQIDGQASRVDWVNQFYADLETVFLKVFEDDRVKIEFERKSYRIFIELSDGRQINFNVLPAGQSALLYILMDLTVRVDLIRKQVQDNTYDPCGTVLIDEPEEHLHLELQEQVLPILTKLFPNIQFIVATHSPAVIASVKNVTVFDIPSQQRRNDEVVGRSYSELMTGHLGLKNEYSSITDEIFKEIQQVINQTRDNPKARKQGIASIIQKNGSYISPTFMVELESMILTSDISSGSR